MNLLPTYEEKINSLKETLYAMTFDEYKRFGAMYENDLKHFRKLAAEAN
jgi:hypothetical protein|tara:strand:- start:384 stop:530 length:147 start_codon:yes stop_codon:yes gene_type:complete